jgi:hypothetical protein
MFCLNIFIFKCKITILMLFLLWLFNWLQNSKKHFIFFEIHSIVNFKLAVSALKGKQSP